MLASNSQVMKSQGQGWQAPPAMLAMQKKRPQNAWCVENLHAKINSCASTLSSTCQTADEHTAFSFALSGPHAKHSTLSLISPSTCVYGVTSNRSVSPSVSHANNRFFQLCKQKKVSRLIAPNLMIFMATLLCIKLKGTCLDTLHSIESYGNFLGQISTI